MRLLPSILLGVAAWAISAGTVLAERTFSLRVDDLAQDIYISDDESNLVHTQFCFMTVVNEEAVLVIERSIGMTIGFIQFKSGDRCDVLAVYGKIQFQ